MGRHNTGKWVRATWRGITNSSKHVGPLLVLYLGILWMSLLGESFHAYPRLIRWGGGGGGRGGDVDSCRDVPQYKVMKYLVFGIISSSLLSELQVMISKVECNGVCICMVYATLWPGGTAECVYRPPLSLVPSVLMSVRFLWLCRLPLRNCLGCVFCWISYWL